jgi:hypothetical protein
VSIPLIADADEIDGMLVQVRSAAELLDRGTAARRRTAYR